MPCIGTRKVRGRPSLLLPPPTRPSRRRHGCWSTPGGVSVPLHEIRVRWGEKGVQNLVALNRSFKCSYISPALDRPVHQSSAFCRVDEVESISCSPQQIYRRHTNLSPPTLAWTFTERALCLLVVRSENQVRSRADAPSSERPSSTPKSFIRGPPSFFSGCL